MSGRLVGVVLLGVLIFTIGVIRDIVQKQREFECASQGHRWEQDVKGLRCRVCRQRVAFGSRWGRK